MATLFSLLSVIFVFLFLYLAVSDIDKKIGATAHGVFMIICILAFWIFLFLAFLNMENPKKEKTDKEIKLEFTTKEILEKEEKQEKKIELSKSRNRGLI